MLGERPEVDLLLDEGLDGLELRVCGVNKQLKEQGLCGGHVGSRLAHPLQRKITKLKRATTNKTNGIRFESNEIIID